MLLLVLGGAYHRADTGEDGSAEAQLEPGLSLSWRAVSHGSGVARSVAHHQGFPFGLVARHFVFTVFCVSQDSMKEEIERTKMEEKHVSGGKIKMKARAGREKGRHLSPQLVQKSWREVVIGKTKKKKR